ncbi:MAG: hypothetical protein KJ702_15310, partial [Gammaproteobacteria bacterium]|nr:hypothetical protein [Gammaproteobacteria bacterium]
RGGTAQCDQKCFITGLSGGKAVQAEHLLALAASFYHAATWFNATQKAMPIQLGEEFVPGNLISGAHYVAWAALSIVILFLAGVF